MLPLNLWEHQNAVKTLYAKCIGTICQTHQITRMELDILLFLANNPCYDTATDIVEIRYLSKSQVSSSIKSLESRGLLRKEYARNNRKTAHLRICPEASRMIADGRKAQEKFFEVMMEGITERELNGMKKCTEKMWNNIDRYLETSMNRREMTHTTIGGGQSIEK